MPEKRNERDQLSKAQAQQTATHQAAANQVREMTSDFTQLLKQIEKCQRNSLNTKSNEERELKQIHQSKIDEYLRNNMLTTDEKNNSQWNEQATDVQKMQESSNDHSQSDRADKSPNVEKDQELDAIKAFQNAQIEQISKRQRLEQRVFEEFARDLAALDARQKEKIDELKQRIEKAGPEAKQDLNNELQQMQEKQQEERKAAENGLKPILDELQRNRETMQAQIKKDQGMLQEALYRSPNSHRDLQQVLAKQEASFEENLRNVEEALNQQKRSDETNIRKDQSFDVFRSARIEQKQEKPLEAGSLASVERLKQQHETDKRAENDRVAANQMRDMTSNFTQLLKQIENCQRNSLNTKANEERELKQIHQSKIDEYLRNNMLTTDEKNNSQWNERERAADVQKKQESSNDRSQFDRADKSPNVERNQELDAIKAFQNAQIEQILKCQQLEQRVFEEFARDLAALDARQKEEIDKLKQRIEKAAPEAKQELNNELQQMQEKQQEERKAAENSLKSVLDELQRNRETMQAQIKKDQGMLQEALYRSLNSRQDLQQVLAKQEASFKENLRNVEDSLNQQKRSDETNIRKDQSSGAFRSVKIEKIHLKVDQEKPLEASSLASGEYLKQHEPVNEVDPKVDLTTESGLELERGTPETTHISHNEVDSEVDLTTESGLELERGTPETTHISHNEVDPEVDLTAESGLELERGTPETTRVSHNEVEPQIDLTKKTGLSIAKSEKARQKVFRRRPAKPKFGDPSGELTGTDYRTGLFYHEKNAAEIGPGQLRIQFDKQAGRPIKVTFELKAAMLKGYQSSERNGVRPDISIDAPQPIDSAFTNSGYERGHLAPREAFKTLAEVIDQTTNIVPMTENLNKVVWRNAEIRRNKLVKENGSVKVEIEPIYDINPKRLKDGTPIPKAITQIIKTADGQILEAASYFNI